MKLGLGRYIENQDIHPRYSSIYQNDIWVNIWNVGYHPSWYLVPWYPKIMLDIKMLMSGPWILNQGPDIRVSN
jgi:hypothetical protein